MENPNHHAFARQIGLGLYKQRRKLGLTQANLAERLNIEPETISRFERGVALPSIMRLVNMAELLDCTVAELMGTSFPVATDQYVLLSGFFKKLSSEDRQMVIRLVQRLAGAVVTEVEQTVRRSEQ